VPKQKHIRRRGVVQEVVDVSKDTKPDAAMKQFRELEDLARDGEFTPDELLKAKNDIVDGLDRVSRKNSDDNKKDASIAILCTKCNTINHTQYGDICTSCHNPLVNTDRLAMQHMMNQEDNVQDNHVEETYWNSIEWDLEGKTEKGRVRLVLDSVSDIHGAFGQDVTQFSFTVLLEVTVKKRIHRTNWKVNHWFPELVEFSNNVIQAKLLSKKSKKQLKALKADYKENIPEKNHEEAEGKVKSWLQTLNKVLTEVEKEKAQIKFYKSSVADEFLELKLHEQNDINEML